MGVAFVFSIIIILDQPLGGRIQYHIGREPLKLLLQFLLITVVGGATFALLSLMKEEQVRREARLKSIQAMEREMTEVYRIMKQCKRRLRSRLVVGNPDPKVPVDDFRASMEELLGVQIRVEALEDDLGSRVDLLDEVRLSQLAKLLHYSARYLHDVYEDFEKGRVPLEGKSYIIRSESDDADRSCFNLIGFIDTPKRVANSAIMPRDVGYVLGKMKEPKITLSVRVAALDDIERIRKDLPGKPRYTKVAYQCFRIAAAEVRDAARDIVNNQRPLWRK
jgi:hypothetical protein